MSVLDEILQESLPTRSARWVAGVTIALGAASFGLPEFLSKLEITIPITAELLVRLTTMFVVLFVGTLLVLVFVLRHLHSLAPPALSDEGSQQIVLNRADPLPSILALIAKYHSQEIAATPRRVASDLAMDADIILAFMWKYHNEQFFTFRNDGRRPDLDTAFFLSPKAWDVIRIVKA